ncbi:hypothetical protein [Halarcobacter sp.]|uniref:hypothetical protein n=1 Tax=Halarcobacter sp. TaxID=2321133 RepID=UPI003A8E4403
MGPIIDEGMRKVREREKKKSEERDSWKKYQDYNFISDVFLRQRRNLIIITFLILFVFISGNDIKEINLLGIKFIFTEENSFISKLKSFLFVIWLYLLFRYYIHLGRSEPFYSHVIGLIQLEQHPLSFILKDPKKYFQYITDYWLIFYASIATVFFLYFESIFPDKIKNILQSVIEFIPS